MAGLGLGLAGLEQFCCVGRLESTDPRSCPAAEPAGRQVGGTFFAGSAEVVLVGAGVEVVGAATEVVVAGVEVVGPAAEVVVAAVEVVGPAAEVVVTPVVVPCAVGVVVTVDAAIGACALRAMPPPIQPLIALDIASVLASSDSRERQPARECIRSLRSISGTFGRSPESRP